MTANIDRKWWVLTASGVLAAAFNVGMVLGIGLAGAIFNTHLAQKTPAAGVAG